MLSCTLSSLFYWLKKLSKFISIQIINQALSVTSGIIIVRTLSQEEYGYFTVINAMQATINMLADSGISTALLSIGGKVWQDPVRLGKLVSSAKQIRVFLGILVATLVAPVLLWMLVRNNLNIAYAILLLAIVLFELYFYLVEAVLLVVLQLKSQLGKIQALDIFFSSSRLTLLGLAYFTVKLNIAVVAFISAISTGCHAWLMSRLVSNYIQAKALNSKEYKTEILEVVKYQAPNTIFYCFQGQITIFLITVFGNVKNIAELGALSRLSVVFAVIVSVMTHIVMPSLARCHDSRLLWKHYFQIIGFYCIFSIAFIGIITAFPNQALLILGSKYSYLRKEVVLIAIGTAIQSFAGTLWSVNTSKGWIKLSWAFIPLTICTQLISLPLVNISSTSGAIIFGFLPSIPALVLNFIMTFRGINMLRKASFI